MPQVAVEAVMLRPQNEKFDLDAAIEELSRSSFIEVRVSADRNTFLNVPLVAAISVREHSPLALKRAL